MPTLYMIVQQVTEVSQSSVHKDDSSNDSSIKLLCNMCIIIMYVYTYYQVDGRLSEATYVHTGYYVVGMVGRGKFGKLSIIRQTKNHLNFTYT